MTELQVINPITVFEAVEGMDLKTLQNTYAELPDIETKEGYTFIKDGIKEIRGYVKSVEEIRETHKRPILDAGRELDGEAKRIDGILRGLVSPMAELKKEVDSRKKREKEAFEAKMQEKIDDIKNFVNLALNQPSSVISDYINDVGEIDTNHDFYHRSGDAGIARAETLEKLTDMLTTAIESEQAQERLKALEEAEAKRLSEQVDNDHEFGLMMNEKFDRDLVEHMRLEKIAEKERFDASEKERIANEKRIADEAVKQAKIDADNAAKKAKEDARIAAEKAEADKIAAVAKAQAEAERKAKEAESQRIADELAAKKEADKKAANKAHQSKVMKAAKESIIEFGLEEAFAKELVLAIAKGKITNVKMEF